MTDNAPQDPQKVDPQKTDRRIARTRSALWNALLTILQREPWDQINVRMICDEANVARSSFYLHFQNKHELLDFGFVIGMEETRQQVRSVPSGKTLGTFVWLVAHVRDSRVFFRKAHGTGSPIHLRFQKTVATLLKEELGSKNIAASDACVTFIIGGVFALLADWVTNGSGENPDIFAGTLQELTDKVIQGS